MRVACSFFERFAKLEKSGFEIWERTLTVGAGATATIDPTLEKQE